jgi:hypothetical protein
MRENRRFYGSAGSQSHTFRRGIRKCPEFRLGINPIPLEKMIDELDQDG